MRLKVLLPFLISGFFTADIFAQATVSSVGGGGLWSNPATWDLGVPAPGDNVIISAGDVVNADAGATPISTGFMEIYGTLIVDNGVTLTVTGSTQANVFGQDFTIDGVSPGIVTNNGTFVLDQGAAGNNPVYENAAGASFTNNSVFTIDNDADFLGNGTFVNAGTMNITSSTGATTFENYVNTNNTGGTINVNSASTFLNGTGGSFGLGNGTILMNAGSFYQHSQNGGTIPTATWNSTSTCTITGITNTALAGGLAQSFGNFVWNCTSQSATINLAGLLTTVNGSLTISDIGASKILQLAVGTNPTINIGGDFVMSSNSGDILQFASTGSPVINVTGNFTLSGGKILMCSTGSPVLNVTGNFTHSSSTSSNTFIMTNGAAGAPVINITGNFSLSGNSSGALTMSASSGIGTINLTGNFSYTAGSASRITESSSGKGVFVFNKAGTQTFSSSVTVPFGNQIETTVNVGSTLDVSASTANLVLSSGTPQQLTINGTLLMGGKTLIVSSATTFTLASGATLNTTNASGVNATIIAGAPPGTRTFNNGANYILGGASTSTGFSGINGSNTMNNLTTTASATLDAAIVVNGTFLNSAGTFSTANNGITGAILTNNGTITAGSSAISTTGAFTNAGTFTANTSTVSIGGNYVNNGTLHRVPEQLILPGVLLKQ